MQEDTSPQDLKARLSLIESMIAEGRRTTAKWGWTFVLWGVAFYIALAWSAWGSKAEFSWPVTMLVTALITSVMVSRQTRSNTQTAMSRAVGSVWLATGVALFVVLASLGFSGRLDAHLFVAILGGILGATNATSSMILKWRLQFACAVVWWATSIAACFSSVKHTMIAFVAAIFLCEIVFGIYGMVMESRRTTGTAHA